MQIGPIRITLRLLVFLGGLALAPFVGLLVVLATLTPITSSGLGYTIGVVLFMLGALLVLWRPRLGGTILFVGFATMAAIAGMRVALHDDRRGPVRLVTLPDEGETQWLNRLIHERDLALFGTHAAYLSGVGLNPDEHEGLAAALGEAYQSMSDHEATTASPFFATYLFQQSPEEFDAVVIEPQRANVAPQAAVVYLHGFGGSFVVQGWLVAQAASRINAVTVAPSVGFIGNWWTPQGKATVKATIDYLRKRGIRRIYLAGLSNGGVGVCRLAPSLKSDLDGLIVISGADVHTLDAGLPVLALHGNDDARMRPDAAMAYAQQAGDRGTYREFDGDHLLLAKQAREVRKVLAAWLVEQEARAAAR